MSDTVPIRVSGNIISELSEKIPNNIIALNELIKNSYDAGSNNVSIKLNSNDKTLTITDDGSGMDVSNIETLFHISQSEKKYGQINGYGRRTQGSKGLGFLSVFKFGKSVVWHTKKENEAEIKFEINRDDFVQSLNITDNQILLDASNEIENKGTKIIMSIDNDDDLKNIKKYFETQKNINKIIYGFDNNDFKINLNIDNTTFSGSGLPDILTIFPERQLYHITYSSSDRILHFYWNNREIFNKIIEFKYNEYELNMNLVIYQLPPYGKNNIDQFFYNNEDALTPLIYINSNLFNNYTLFNPDIQSSAKTGKTLRQIIGYIKINSDNSAINFNSDRTQFLQNNVTNSIGKFLADINKTTQVLGSEMKTHLMDFDILKDDIRELPEECNDKEVTEDFRQYIKKDFYFKDQVVIKRELDTVTYTFCGKEIQIKIKPKEEKNPSNSTSGATTEASASKEADDPTASATSANTANEASTTSDEDNTPEIRPAKIDLKREQAELKIPSEQLNLNSYIKIALDSYGNEIDFKNIEILVDGVECKNHILESISEICTKNIKYTYIDTNTGNVTSNIKLIFSINTSNTVNANCIGKLIEISGDSNYTLNFTTKYIQNLIFQINSLELDKYQEIIACSLRAIFDLCVSECVSSGKYKHIIKGPGLNDNVKSIVEYIKNNNKFITAIDNSNHSGYNLIKNALIPNDYYNAVEKSNLGVHHSAKMISSKDIEQIAKKIGIFVIVVNEMIYNPNIR